MRTLGVARAPRVLLFWVVLAIDVSMCWAVKPPIDDKAETQLGLLSEKKAVAEQLAILLKESFDPDSGTFAKGRQLYLTAAAATHGTLEALKLVLDQGKQIRDAQHGARIASATSAISTFVDYANKELSSAKGGGDLLDHLPLTDLITTMLNQAKVSAEARRDARLKAREAVRECLEQLELARFDGLGIAKPPTSTEN